MSDMTVILLNNDGMGQAAPELRHKLISTYLQMLIDGDWKPAVICSYAEGVKLAVTGSPVLEQLKQLEASGVMILLCSTCLGFYELREQVQVGIVGGMHDIMEAQQRASKVITL